MHFSFLTTEKVLKPEVLQYGRRTENWKKKLVQT
jgi:hypothetical protein